MIIGAKSGLDTFQLKDRQSKGGLFVEFFTKSEDFKETIDFKRIKRDLIDLNLISYAVHSPMENYSGEHCSIGIINKQERFHNNDLILKSIELAGKICEYESPIVIIHIDGMFDLSKRLTKESKVANRIEEEIKIIEEDLSFFNDFITKNYPNMVLGVENNPSFIIDNNKTSGFLYGKNYDIPLLLKQLKLKNIKAVLDICHAQSVCNMEIIQGDLLRTSNKTIIDYIRNYYDVLTLIHMVSLKDFGETKEKHGIAFGDTEEDILYLMEIFEELNKLGYKNPITIEVSEQNYLDALNFQGTVKSIEKAINLLNLKYIRGRVL